MPLMIVVVVVRLMRRRRRMMVRKTFYGCGGGCDGCDGGDGGDGGVVISVGCLMPGVARLLSSIELFTIVLILLLF
jgi:hypothetical protein